MDNGNKKNSGTDVMFGSLARKIMMSGEISCSKFIADAFGVPITELVDQPYADLARRFIDRGIDPGMMAEQFSSPIYEIPTKEQLNVLSKIIEEINPSRVVEIGCGVGLWSFALRRRLPNLEVVPTDISKSVSVFSRCIDDVVITDSLDEYANPGTMFIWSWVPFTLNPFHEYPFIAKHPVVFIGEGPEGCCGAEEMFTRPDAITRIITSYALGKTNVIVSNNKDQTKHRSTIALVTPGECPDIVFDEGDIHKNGWHYPISLDDCVIG